MKITILHEDPDHARTMAIAIRRNGVRASLPGILPGGATALVLGEGEAVSVMMGPPVEKPAPVVVDEPSEAKVDEPKVAEEITSNASAAADLLVDEPAKEITPPKPARPKKMKPKRRAAKKRAAKVEEQPAGASSNAA
jgi:hypothetical protein